MPSFAVYRDTGKVAHMLVGAGQLIEQRRFAAVLVAGQGKTQRLSFGNLTARLAVVVAGGLAQFAHAGGGAQARAVSRCGQRGPFLWTLSTSILAASASRRVSS